MTTPSETYLGWMFIDFNDCCMVARIQPRALGSPSGSTT